VADVLRACVLETPPNAGGGVRDLLGALKFGNRLRKHPLELQRDLLGLFTRSAADWLEDWFESEPVKAAFGFDSVVGAFASPYHPGTGYVLLHHCFGEVNGRRGLWGHAIGGMGAISEALAAEARRLGVQIECEAPVAKVLPGSVILEDGRELPARAVAANVNPKLLFLRLVDPGLLARDFRERMERYKCGSATFRMNVALSSLPRFACLPEEGPHHASGIIMAPSLAYMDRAYLDARASGIARRPIVEMVIPSTLDDSLAPRGAHVASLFCQHFSPEADWAARKQEAVERIFDVVESHAPGFRQSVLAHSALSPADLERDFGLTGGDIFHGQLSLDQLWSARPVLGHADYRTPVKGVYLCGSGAHPGGGVTGAPGHNCAREILRDFGRRFPA
jgi:phytoene dehydrogenase-like protein